MLENQSNEPSINSSTLAYVTTRCYAYIMAMRTTLVLDEPARAAARQLARRYGCSVSEAIRRSLIRQRDAEIGVPAARRRQRMTALRRLVSLFEGNDAAAEIRRLKAEDGGF